MDPIGVGSSNVVDESTQRKSVRVSPTSMKAKDIDESTRFLLRDVDPHC